MTKSLSKKVSKSYVTRIKKVIFRGPKKSSYNTTQHKMIHHHHYPRIIVRGPKEPSDFEPTSSSPPPPLTKHTSLFTIPSLHCDNLVKDPNIRPQAQAQAQTFIPLQYKPGILKCNDEFLFHELNFYEVSDWYMVEEEKSPLCHQHCTDFYSTEYSLEELFD